MDERKTFRCAWCKKTKPMPPAGPGYGYMNKDCCSYTCQRALERADPNSYLSIKENAEKEKARRRSMYDQKHYITKYMVAKRVPKQISKEEERAKIKQMFKAGTSVTAIAKETHLSIPHISKLLEEAGLRTIQRRRGKLRPDELEKMKKLHAEGTGVCDISRMMGISESVVSKRLRQK